MTVSHSLERTLAASEAWLLEQDAPESAIAAHESGEATSDDQARRWVRRLLDEQDRDGSWGGDLLQTAEALTAIDELRTAAGIVEQDPGIGLAADWIRSRRGLPGTWADGCSEERHALGLCHHFVGGLFSAARPETVYGEARLRSGARVEGDQEVRLVASATALRCVHSRAAPSRDDGLHMAALRRVVELWGRHGPMGLSTTALLASVHALVQSDADADREAVARGLRLVGGKQRGDGSWVDTDAFQALDVIGTVADAGIAPDLTSRALWHGARLLIASQQADGSWGSDHGPRRALIAWRTFRRIEPGPAQHGP